jgi:hypothetical protein
MCIRELSHATCTWYTLAERLRAVWPFASHFPDNNGLDNPLITLVPHYHRLVLRLPVDPLIALTSEGCFKGFKALSVTHT